MHKTLIILTKLALRNLKKVPWHIVARFKTWADLVENEGLREIRKIKSFHDEPLKGDRKGQRSIRLSKSYRAFYIEKSDGEIEFIEVLEVNKHDY
jgi:toxin HigB-1